MFVCPIILIILLHWWSSFVAQSYQSSNFLGGDSRVRIRFCKGMLNVSWKRSIMTGDDLSNFDSDTIIRNLAMCSSIKFSFFHTQRLHLLESISRRVVWCKRLLQIVFELGKRS